MKLVFISLLLFLPVVVSQDVCPSCVDELLLNLTANIEDTENSTMLSIAKLVVESEALLSKTCNASDLEFLNVEADVDCFQLTASGGIIPPGESAQLFGPITFLENTTLWDTISLLDRNDGFYNITAEGGTMIALRVADNILKYGSHRKTTRLYMFIQMILIIAGAILVLSGAIYFYSKRPELIPPYVRYEERIRVGLEPLPTIEEEPQMVLSEASPSNNVLLVSYSHINETVTITDEEGTPLEKSIVAPASEVEATAT